MYQYLKTAYEQWCCGQDYQDILDRESVFLALVHNMMGYDEQTAKKFLLEQPWYHSKDK